MAKGKDRSNLLLTAEHECSSVVLERTAIRTKEWYTCDGHLWSHSALYILGNYTCHTGLKFVQFFLSIYWQAGPGYLAHYIVPNIEQGSVIWRIKIS